MATTVERHRCWGAHSISFGFDTHHPDPLLQGDQEDGTVLRDSHFGHLQARSPLGDCRWRGLLVKALDMWGAPFTGHWPLGTIAQRLHNSTILYTEFCNLVSNYDSKNKVAQLSERAILAKQQNITVYYISTPLKYLLRDSMAVCARLQPLRRQSASHLLHQRGLHNRELHSKSRKENVKKTP